MTNTVALVGALGLIAYTYVGYPLLLAGVSHLVPSRRASAAGRLPTVTVLIAAYREESTLAAKLENTLALAYPDDRLEVVVAADDEPTAAVARSFSGRGVRLVAGTRRSGKAAAIDRAMGRVTSEVVVFSDANNRYEPQTLRRLVAPFGDCGVGAVTGAKTVSAHSEGGGVGSSEGLYWRYESRIKEWESRLSSCTGVAGEILAVRRDAYRPIPPDVINDDFWLAMQVLRQGLDIVYCPEARSVEPVSASASDEVARRSRIVAGRYQAIARAREVLPWRRPFVVWQLVSHKLLRPLVPLAAVVALVAAITGSRSRARHRDLARAALAAQAGFYASAWGGRRFERSGSRLGKLLYLPTFLVDSNRAALAGLWRFARGAQTVLWERVPRAEPTATLTSDPTRSTTSSIGPGPPARRSAR